MSWAAGSASWRPRSRRSRPSPLIIENALSARHVLRLDYVDKHGVPTEREVEPVMFLAGPEGWYLLGWCRLRDGMRAFRLDRIITGRDTGEPAPDRDHGRIDLPGHVTVLT
ncbi:helix-turn-helix transcriptional regulator [Actinophytocola sp.]|uniref:helix-turn-helix transcriptional regulator n=1 Tax=Actinophytocola sp. TaxID=1872138 RepID=UPI002ED4EAE9